MKRRSKEWYPARDITPLYAFISSFAVDEKGVQYATGEIDVFVFGEGASEGVWKACVREVEQPCCRVPSDGLSLVSIIVYGLSKLETWHELSHACRVFRFVLVPVSSVGRREDYALSSAEREIRATVTVMKFGEVTVSRALSSSGSMHSTWQGCCPVGQVLSGGGNMPNCWKGVYPVQRFYLWSVNVSTCTWS
jgi:hypothetical protein